jgi:protein O-GlcNAc transferase
MPTPQQEAANLHHQGQLRGRQGDWAAAVEFFERSLAVAPNSPQAAFDLGNALQQLGRKEEALTALSGALALKADFWEALEARSAVYRDLGRIEDCLADLDRLAVVPEWRALAWYNRGFTLVVARRWTQAVEAFDRLLAVRPNAPRALALRSNALRELGRLNEALADSERAIALDPNHSMAFFNRGATLLALGRRQEALAALNRAMELDPGNIPARSCRAVVLHLLERLQEALADAKRVLAVRPDLSQMASIAAYIAALMCDWREGTAAVADLKARVEGGQDIDPWMVLVLLDEPRLQLQAARRAAATAAPRKPFAARRHERLRIAYLSTDFRDHPTGYQTVEVFERHDRSRFETFGLSLKTNPDGPLKQRFQHGFERFLELGGRSDGEVAKAVAAAEIDIAVDLSGYTLDSRMKVLASRQAPLAVHFFGYPGTLGSGTIDYLIADPYVVPPGAEGFYGEAVARLPDCYFPADTNRAEPPALSRAEAGLPEQGFVFASFNNPYKITPQFFDIWMRLLRQVPGSVLWLLARPVETRGNLCREAEARGVPCSRLVFAERAVIAQHLARQRLADLFLDTLPCNAHTTANDALWMGLPLVTCSGEGFAARVAGSMLRAAAVPELIAAGLADYEALALALAQSPGHLAAIRDKLFRNRTTAPLFDMERFCRHLEDAYTTMWDIHRSGREPESFTVPARPPAPPA